MYSMQIVLLRDWSASLIILSHKKYRLTIPFRLKGSAVKDTGKENKQGQAAESAARLLTIVGDLLTEMHPGQKDHPGLSLDSSLDRDLGLDSLAQVELLARTEKAFDITLSEQILATVDTVRDLLRAIMSSGAPKRETVAREVAAVKLDRIADSPLMAETLVEVLEWHVKNHPNRPHITFYSDRDDGGEITYQELWHGAELVASGLQHSGLAPGETVLIMLPTGSEYFFTFFGVLIAGGIPVPVYPPGRLKQIEEHLLRHVAITNNCLASFMVTVEEAMPFVKLLHSQAHNLRHVMTVPELSAAGTEALPDFKKPALTRDNLAFLQYTSGSTGMPKGVILSHANLLANIRAMAKVLDVTSDDVFISWLPLYHDMGLIGAWFGSLHFACRLVIMPPLAFIAKPQRWLWAIHKYRGTLSAAPNFAYELCLRRLDDKDIAGLDLSSWRIACNGAEAVNPVTMKRFIERFAPYGFRPETMRPVYGLAESSVGLAFPRPGTPLIIDRIKRDVFLESARAVPFTGPDIESLEYVGCGEVVLRPIGIERPRVADSLQIVLPDPTQLEADIQEGAK